MGSCRGARRETSSRWRSTSLAPCGSGCTSGKVWHACVAFRGLRAPRRAILRPAMSLFHFRGLLPSLPLARRPRWCPSSARCQCAAHVLHVSCTFMLIYRFQIRSTRALCSGGSLGSDHHWRHPCCKVRMFASLRVSSCSLIRACPSSHAHPLPVLRCACAVAHTPNTRASGGTLRGTTVWSTRFASSILRRQHHLLHTPRLLRLSLSCGGCRLLLSLFPCLPAA